MEFNCLFHHLWHTFMKLNGYWLHCWLKTFRDKQSFEVLMSNKNAPPSRCTGYQNLCTNVLCIFIVYDKCNVFAQKFQFEQLRDHTTYCQPPDCINRIFGANNSSQKSRTNVFFSPVNYLAFCHKFDCCNATLNTLLMQNISLHKRQNCLALDF